MQDVHAKEAAAAAAASAAAAAAAAAVVVEEGEEEEDVESYDITADSLLALTPTSPDVSVLEPGS